MPNNLFNFWDQMKVNFVPDIGDAELSEMLAQMKPVMEVGGRFREIKMVHPRDDSFIWDPKPGRLVQLYLGSLNSVDIITFHRSSIFFKPSMAEVMASIRRFVPDWSPVRFFQVVPDSAVRIDGGHILARCRLFGGEQRDVIDEMWERDVAALAAAE